MTYLTASGLLLAIILLAQYLHRTAKRALRAMTDEELALAIAEAEATEAWDGDPGFLIAEQKRRAALTRADQERPTTYTTTTAAEVQ